MTNVEGKIHEIVELAIEEINEDEEIDEKISSNFDTILFGEKGAGIDSFSFVTMISCIEDHILEVFNREIYLVGDGVYDKEYNPFLTVGNLEKYIKELLQEEN